MYEDPVDGVVLWLLGDDGRRRRLRQVFPACMCARGPAESLAALERFLRERFARLGFQPGERRDVFAGCDVPVLLVEAPRPSDLRTVLREAARAFPRLEYADADLALSLRFAARTGLFPLARTAKNDPQYLFLKKRAAALKWLLVTCFGYLGYKNARFGRIEAHQAVTAYGREALICAKEAAEDAGFEVIQMYVDGLWVKGTGDVQALTEEILRRTGLPIGIEGLYRWVAFLPSRQHAGRAAANRYFGVFQDGTLKVRGIDARRRDTPPLIAALQMEMLQLLAGYADPLEGVAAAAGLARKRLGELRRGSVALQDLLVAHKLGREPEEYKANSAAARAAKQVKAAGGLVKPGQRVKFIYTLGRPGVHAWELPGRMDPKTVDLPRYAQLLLRAAREVLRPFEADMPVESLLVGQHQPELPGQGGANKIVPGQRP